MPRLTLTDEQRQEMRIRFLKLNVGVPKSEIQKERMSAARMGRKDSEETKARKSAAQKAFNVEVRKYAEIYPYLTWKECEEMHKQSDGYKRNKPRIWPDFTPQAK